MKVSTDHPGAAHSSPASRRSETDEPLSFWGGFESETGTIIDQATQVDQSLIEKIVMMTVGRGSSPRRRFREAIRDGLPRRH